MNSERLNILLKQLQSDGNDPFILYGIAMEYLSAGDYEMAANYLIKNVEEFPDYLPTYYQLGLALEELDKIEEARKILEIGLNIAQENGEEKTAREIQQFLINLEY